MIYLTQAHGWCMCTHKHLCVYSLYPSRCAGNWCAARCAPVRAPCGANRVHVKGGWESARYFLWSGAAFRNWA